VASGPERNVVRSRTRNTLERPVTADTFVPGTAFNSTPFDTTHRCRGQCRWGRRSPARKNRATRSRMRRLASIAPNDGRCGWRGLEIGSDWRHEFRYHDGAAFTGYVSDNGTVTTETPTTWWTRPTATPRTRAFSDWGYQDSYFSSQPAPRRRTGLTWQSLSLRSRPQRSLLSALR